MLSTNNFFRIYIILIFFSFSTSVFSQDEDAEKEGLRAEYISYLTKEGFRPSVDRDGDIKFKKEGTLYYIMTRNNRLFWIMRTLSKEDACENKFLRALDKVNRMYLNVTTAVTYDCTGLTISSRSWLTDPDDWKDILIKSMDSIDNAYDSSQKYYYEEE